MGAKGVNLWDINICTLLYADYLILIADSETDLKLQINSLGNFADRYRMEINPQKTKVMIFHEKNKPPNETTFSSIGKHQIKVTNEYKYLGVILDNKGSFKNHVEMQVEKSVKCIYSVLTKNREWKGFKRRLLLHLFDHLIAPVISYGCEIWGNQNWDETERIHLYFCKLTLGVKPSTPTDGIYAELGRYPLTIFRKFQMVKFAIRISNLNGSRYANKALKVLIEDDMKGHYNWFSQVTDIIKSTDIVDENDNNESIKKKIVENYNHSLSERINNCDQGKKLRTYRKFKSDIKFEPYLDTIENSNLRKSLSKFRLSSHDLEIRRGRYGKKSTPPERRICKICNSPNLIQDEYHFLMICPTFFNLRNDVFTFLNSSNSNFKKLSDENKFTWLSSQEDKIITLKLANYIQKQPYLETRSLKSLMEENDN